MMLTVEEGGACLDSLGALRDLYRLGVRMMTLTWNFKNGLAEPNILPGTDDMWPRPANTTGGLTEKGLEFAEEMQRLHMLVDVSHLSDAGIWDILRVAKRPFVASHSNARLLPPCAQPDGRDADRHGRKGLPDWPELLRFLPGYKPRPQPGQEPHHRYGPPRPLYYG